MGFRWGREESSDERAHHWGEEFGSCLVRSEQRVCCKSIGDCRGKGTKDAFHNVGRKRIAVDRLQRRRVGPGGICQFAQRRGKMGEDFEGEILFPWSIF